MKLLALLLAAASQAAPPSQNPSPMVERTRAHERIAERRLPGARATFTGPGDKPVQLFIPQAAAAARAVSLVIHFHGASFLPEYAVAQLRRDHIAASVHVGAGSALYDRTFSPPAVFDSLLASIALHYEELSRRPLRTAELILSGFSAGHGAIRAILRDSAHFARVDGVLLLDGLHTAYDPPGKVLAEGGRLDPATLQSMVAFAQAAATGRKRLLITHSEIFPGTFASTTETTDYLIETLGLRRKALLRWGPLGMQQTSQAGKGALLIAGFAGNSAPDHIDHFHGMYAFLAALHRLRP